MATGQTQLTDENKEESRGKIVERRRPDYVAKMPIQKGQWMKVGYAYHNPRTETFTVYFSVLPDKCKVVLFRD